MTTRHSKKSLALTLALSAALSQHALAAPTDVKDVDQPARNPHVMSTTTLNSTGMFIFPAIPADRRFVIEYVSGTCSASGGVIPNVLRVTLFGQADHYVAPELYNGGTVATFGVMTRLYVPPSRQVGLTIFPTTATPLVACNVTLSGHWVLL